MSGVRPSPEWQHARRNAAPADDAQRALVQLLELPITDKDVVAQAQRKDALVKLVESIALDPTAIALHRRLTRPTDHLSRFLDLELSRPLRADLRRRLDSRVAQLQRSTTQLNRGVPPPTPTPTSPTGPLPPLYEIVPVCGLYAPIHVRVTPPIPLPGVIPRVVVFVPGPCPPQQPPPPPPPPPPKPKPDPDKPKPDPDKPKPDPDKPKPDDRKKRKRKGPPPRPDDDDDTGPFGWLLDALGDNAKAGVVSVVALAGLPLGLVAAAFAAAAAAAKSGLGLSAVGEAAADAAARWALEQGNIDPSSLVDLNELFRSNFPGLDFISRDLAIQAKAWGVVSKATTAVVAAREVQAFLRLAGAKRWVSLPATTAKALLKNRAVLEGMGAWPTALQHAKTVEDVKPFLRTVKFAVPSDHVSSARALLAKAIVDDAAVRELFSELALGHTTAFNALSPAVQNALAAKIQTFTFDRFMSMGVSTKQLRAIMTLADLASP